jgi:hypothetical protein
LITKEELLQAVWPETFVEESALKGCIQAPPVYTNLVSADALVAE